MESKPPSFQKNIPNHKSNNLYKISVDPRYSTLLGYMLSTSSQNKNIQEEFTSFLGQCQNEKYLKLIMDNLIKS